MEGSCWTPAQAAGSEGLLARSTEGPRAPKVPALTGPAAAQGVCFHREHPGLPRLLGQHGRCIQAQGAMSPVPKALLLTAPHLTLS